MQVINKLAHLIDDVWCYSDLYEDIKSPPNTVLPLGTLAAIALDAPLCRPLGVLAPAGTTADRIVAFLSRVDLVVVEFPKFRDGRGFTLARTLREKHGFEGDIRAIGHILPDQFAALMQCGFSSIELPANHPVDQWTRVVPGIVTTSTAGPLLQRLLGKRDASTTKREKT
ncbi:DUF934 domain-containing protein [Rhizobium hainanense]|uniref:Uncharacterized conserved protein, DUF934 family n=1 Tax=Rhizobium hainanense TaxID=52131 RepID=A0A1C3W853_9HYPH|nr:DUF934 domain-containing protein [Rhizobium hainanense]SCB36153.1 Uncharacterized conserved protein, DUF934 family [Rhizobium hainanense]